MSISTVTAAVNLSNEYNNFLNNYSNMLSAANAFVQAGNILKNDANIGIASTDFQNSAVTVLNQVTSFLASAPTSFPAA